MRDFIVNIHHKSSKTALLLATVAMLILGLFLLFSKSAFAEDPTANNNQRLVTIYDQGKEITVVTKALTIGQVLEQAEVSVGENDIVEPALSETMTAKTYQVNIFRARPIIVIDGSRQIKVITAEQSPRKISTQAGITLYDEDETSFDQVDNFLAGEGIGISMTIKRATVFSFTLYGKQFEARTQAKTVEGLLAEKGIVLGKEDGVQPSVKNLIFSGMDVRIWRNGKQTITVEEVVKRPVEEIKTADKPIGFREVREEGADGKRNATYEIEMRDGVEVSRREIASVTTQEPVKQVVVVGIKSAAVPYTGGGSKDEWLAASGIPRDSWGYVDSIVRRESGWNPNATNKSSGACGLAQALPCSKVPGNPYDPVDSLRWMNAYVSGRYYDGSPYAKGLCGGMASSWECAYTFWNVYKWY